jgi:tetratricopeptide (TPR) repeat protein
VSKCQKPDDDRRSLPSHRSRDDDDSRCMVCRLSSPAFCPDGDHDVEYVHKAVTRAWENSVLDDSWQKVRITAEPKVYAMNQVGEKPSKAPAISLNELSRRLFSPDEIPKPSGDEAEPSSLSYIAWQLKQGNDVNNDESSSSFPPFSYLDLRRQQNTDWATDRLTEGNAILFEDPFRAENIYKQGLDLVPDHAELLVGYGKLLSSTKRRPLALAQFQRALEVDPDCISAKEHLERERQHAILLRQESRKVAAPVLRESSAFQDVLLERSLAEEAPVEEEQEVAEKVLREDERKHDERKHKKRRKKHKRRKRGRSPSPTPSSSSDDASEDSSRRNKKRKRNRPSPSLSSAREEDPREDNSSREERRRHRKHRKHHKSKRKHKKRKRYDSPST